MTLPDRNWLFAASRSLDQMRRVVGAKQANGESQLFVVFTHEELERFAEGLRELAAKDEREIVDRITAGGKKR